MRAEAGAGGSTSVCGQRPMLNNLTTGFVNRLKSHDESAWFELWATFGPVLRAQLSKWGRGRIGSETVQDLSQETLAALSDSIERYDPARGARFSTWLLAIAKHTLSDEIDRRMALKRGAGNRGVALDDSWMSAATGPGVSPDGEYETAVFFAKVVAAIRLVERDCEFLDFEIFRRRILESQSGKDVAVALGTSEPTVSRRLSKVREQLRARLNEVIATYSFTDEELAEPERNGLVLNPTKADDALFDEAIADIHHRQLELHGGAAL